MSNIITESFYLPSKGKLYDIGDGRVDLSSMTTEHELRRLSHSELPYSSMCEILDECITNKIGISSYDMCIGDYQFLLYKLRVVTYGGDYPLVTKCPFCGYENHDTLNLDELPVIEYSDEAEKYYEVDLPKTGSHIRLRMSTPRLLDMATSKANEHKKRVKNLTFDPLPLYTIAVLIDTIDGKVPNELTIADWVRKLPMMDTQVILAQAEKLNGSVGINIDLSHTCELCGFEYNSKFKPDAEFFRPTIDIV